MGWITLKGYEKREPIRVAEGWQLVQGPGGGPNAFVVLLYLAGRTIGWPGAWYPTAIGDLDRQWPCLVVATS
jgi:hypothetical protein